MTTHFSHKVKNMNGGWSGKSWKTPEITGYVKSLWKNWFAKSCQLETIFYCRGLMLRFFLTSNTMLPWRKVSPQTCLVVCMFTGKICMSQEIKERGRRGIIANYNMVYCKGLSARLAKRTFLSRTKTQSFQKLLLCRKIFSFFI